MGSRDQSKHNWEAEEYHNNSSAQEIAATQLLQDLHLTGREQVLDVGCGDGKITAKIASLVPSGSVLGIDASPTMIEFAKSKFSKASYPNLTFLQQDGQQIDYPSKFDLIFSSFAIQWMPDKSAFFEAANKCLKPEGHLVATIPLGISSALEKSISIMVSKPEWSYYFVKFTPGWHFISSPEFFELLAKHSFTITHFQTVPQTVIFPSRKAFENYVLPWFSYLNAVPEHLKQAFLKQTVDYYMRVEPTIVENGVSFKFLRLEVIAAKAISSSSSKQQEKL
jgi:trans-aconitate 2-methyltransferase